MTRPDLDLHDESSDSNDDSSSSSQPAEGTPFMSKSHEINRKSSIDEESQSDEDDSASSASDIHVSMDESNEEVPVVSSGDLRKEKFLSLGERLSRQEEELSQRNRAYAGSKERKAKARLLVSQRLAKLKRKEPDPDDSENESKEKKVKVTKKSKHAPTEVSSKRSDFYGRRRNLNESGIGVDIGAHRYKPRDPRVSSLSGHLDEDHFERNFAFLNEIRDKEVEQLKKRIEARKTTGKKGNKKRRKLGLIGEGSIEEDMEKLKQLQQQKADSERKQIERDAKRSVKKRLQEQVQTGQRSASHFLKRREMKALYAEAKFDEIRKRGGDQAVEKALAKRRKKNKSRDARGFRVPGNP